MNDFCASQWECVFGAGLSSHVRLTLRPEDFSIQNCLGLGIFGGSTLGAVMGWQSGFSSITNPLLFAPLYGVLGMAAGALSGAVTVGIFFSITLPIYNSALKQYS